MVISAGALRGAPRLWGPSGADGNAAESEAPRLELRLPKAAAEPRSPSQDPQVPRSPGSTAPGETPTSSARGYCEERFHLLQTRVTDMDARLNEVQRRMQAPAPPCAAEAYAEALGAAAAEAVRSAVARLEDRAAADRAAMEGLAAGWADSLRADVDALKAAAAERPLRDGAAPAPQEEGLGAARRAVGAALEELRLEREAMAASWREALELAAERCRAESAGAAAAALREPLAALEGRMDNILKTQLAELRCSIAARADESRAHARRLEAMAADRDAALGACRTELQEEVGRLAEGCRAYAGEANATRDAVAQLEDLRDVVEAQRREVEAAANAALDAGRAGEAALVASIDDARREASARFEQLETALRQGRALADVAANVARDASARLDARVTLQEREAAQAMAQVRRELASHDEQLRALNSLLWGARPGEQPSAKPAVEQRAESPAPGTGGLADDGDPDISGGDYSSRS